MNKKIYAGMFAFGVAASFWACGDGEILTPTEADGMMAIETGEVNDKSLINDVINEQNCPLCMVGQSSSSSTRRSPRSSTSRSSSSEDSPYSSPVSSPASSSSSADSPYSSPISSPASSAGMSSSTPTLPSSSSQGPSDPNADIGTCAPTPATAGLGDKVTWTFSRGSAVQASALLQATYTWTFEGGTPASSGKVQGATGKNQTVEYATSGAHGASLVFATTGGAHVIQCTPVHINGAAITGCKCSALNKMPDIAEGQVGSWSVTGCASAGHQIIGYEWPAGFTADAATATYTFTAKKQSQAPVVKVANDDNTVQEVQCDEVTAVDANDPDYIINGTATGTFTVGPGSYKMVYACKADQYDQRPVVIEAPNGAVSGSVGGVKFSVSPNGRAETYKSTTSNTPIDVEITSGTAKITCG